MCNNYISPMFYAIYRLTDFSSEPFDFRPQKRDKQVTFGGH